MRFLLAFLAITTAFAQTSGFPPTVAGPTQMGIAVNRVQTVLKYTIGIADTSATVVSSAGIVPNVILNIDNEEMWTCGVSNNVIQFGRTSCPNIDGRAVDNTTVRAHNAGAYVSAFIDAWNFNAARVEITATQAAINSLLPPASPSVPGFPLLSVSSGSTAWGGTVLLGTQDDIAVGKAALNTYWLNPVIKNISAYVNPQGTGTAGVPTIGFTSWMRNANNLLEDNAVAIMDACEVTVPNSSCFGMNIVLGTGGNTTGATNTNRVGIEIDNEGYYTPDTNSFGISVIEYNVANPSPANIVRNGNHAIAGPAWAQSYYSEGGASNTALFAGSRKVDTTPNSDSQNLIFQSTDAFGAQRLGELYADSSGHLILNFTGIQSGSAMKVLQVDSCTTSASQFNTCTTDVTWPTAFADTSYTTECQLIATSGTPAITNIQNSVTASKATVQIIAMTANASGGQLTCWGVHY